MKKKILLLMIGLLVVIVTTQAQNWSELIKSTASDAATGDYYGYSVSVSGDYAIVGAFGNDDAVNMSGSAYILYRNQGGDNNWGEVKKITASDAAESDRFGLSVSISGNYAIVSAKNNNDNGLSSGSAYIFHKDQGGADNWGEVKKITASDADASDQFGYAVSISGNYAIVSATYNQDNGYGTGSAYIFYKDQGGADNWGEVKKITASDATLDDNFGFSVSISGSYAIVGARYNDDGGSMSGSAYIFNKDQGGTDNWGEVKKLLASDDDANDNFGHSVSISGNYAIVGSPGNDDDGGSSGSAYIFYKDQGSVNNWGEVKKLTASDAASSDQFGGSVSISNDNAIVGAKTNDDIGSNSGSAYIFNINEGGANNWGETMKITASDAASSDEFGASVCISSNDIIVGANGNTGYAYVFNKDAPPMQLVFTTSADGQSVYLPLNGTVNCTVDWGDGSPSQDYTSSGDKIHTYTNTATYTVTISGEVTQFGNGNPWIGVEYLTEVISFGDIGVTSLIGAFNSANSLTSVPATLPTTVTNLSNSFQNITQTYINNLNLWDVSNVSNMSYMFYGAAAFNQDIGNWNVANVTNMSSMFGQTLAFNQNIGGWDVSKITTMEEMFYSNEVFNQNIENWNVSSVTNMSSMFCNATAFNQNIGNWDVSSVTDMSGMFTNAMAFNQDIGGWVVSSVTDMSNMFMGAMAFNQYIGDWNVSSVTNMSSMFYMATAFNQDIGNWNVSAVTNMNSMFKVASVFNQNIGGWVVSSVTDMSNMFSSTSAFNQDIGSWNVGSVTNMEHMFSYSQFNQYIGDWNVSSVTNINAMFAGCPFNQNIGNWNVSAVTTMNSVFNNATAFNQDISSWDFSLVTDLSYFLQSATAFNTENYDALLESWNNQNLTNLSTHVNSYYSCQGEADRITLINNGWVINDLGIQNTLTPDVASLPILTADCEITITNFPTASDDCANTYTATTSNDLTYSEQGTYTITWEFENSSVTQQQTVIVEDLTPPTVITQNIDAFIDINGNATILASEIDNGSSDNCSIANLSLDVSSFDRTDVGDVTVTLTATDAAGNQSSEIATVTVIDHPLLIINDMAIANDASTLVTTLLTDAQGQNVITENLEFYIYFTELADGVLTVEELQAIIDLGNALAEINTMAEDDDATSLTIDMINNFDVTNVITENLEFYIYFTELADGVLTVEELQAIIDLANIFGEINDMALEDDATTLTIDMLLELGLLNVIPDNLELYADAIENDVDGFLTLEELQELIDNANLTSVNETAKINVNIYPNPTTGIINLNLTGFENLSGLNLQVTDISGRIIEHSIINTEHSIINLEEQPNGVYFIKLQNNELVKTVKVIKQ